MNKIKFGVSACLLGKKVRYDGGHKRDRFLTGTWGRWVDFLPVCPEAECGLGVPREASRLAGDPQAPRFLTVLTGQDLTARLTAWADQRVKELETVNLCGFIFKSNSPSCGAARVKVYGGPGRPVTKGVGLFARAFMEHFPLTPVTDEDRFHDPEIRESFIARVFTLKRWREVAGQSPDMGRLLAFTSRHRLLLMAHSPGHYRLLEQLLARGREIPATELYARYQELLLKALGRKATVRKHIQVLLHLLGHFRKWLSPEDKQEWAECLENYRKGMAPLLVPVTLINHYVRKHQQSSLMEQYYLNPHPVELQLRYHV